MKNNSHSPVVALDSIPKQTVEAGKATSMQVLISAETAPNFAMRCFTIESGGNMPEHTNTIEHEQYVLSGRATVGIGGEIYQVKQGDVVFIPAGEPHWYRTVGNEAFRFLCLVPNRPDHIELTKRS